MATNEDELITVREAAKECGRNMETVRRWIWSGKLPAEKLGNQLFIKRNDLSSYCRLPARSVPAKVGETAVRYRAERETKSEPGRKADLIKRMTQLRKDTRARGSKPFDITEDIRQMREERMEQIQQGLKDTDAALKDREAKLAFLKQATAIRNRIHARTGKIFDAETMIRELREEREHELE